VYYETYILYILQQHYYLPGSYVKDVRISQRQTDRQTELLFRFVQSTSSKHINNNINCHAIKRFTTLLNWKGKNKYVYIINNGEEHTRFSAQYIQHQNAFVMHV